MKKIGIFCITGIVSALIFSWVGICNAAVPPPAPPGDQEIITEYIGQSMYRITFRAKSPIVPAGQTIQIAGLSRWYDDLDGEFTAPTPFVIDLLIPEINMVKEWDLPLPPSVGIVMNSSSGDGEFYFANPTTVKVRVTAPNDGNWHSFSIILRVRPI